MTVTDCKRQLSSIDNRRVAQCTVNGITWSVWIADRGRHDLSAEDEVEVPWPSKLSVYATMTGRRGLKNYALRIEKVPDNVAGSSGHNATHHPLQLRPGFDGYVTHT